MGRSKSPDCVRRAVTAGVTPCLYVVSSGCRRLTFNARHTKFHSP